MKTFYGVTTEFYDNGTVKAAIITRRSAAKPADSSRELPFMDAYIDWFDTREEAAAMLTEARAA